MESQYEKRQKVQKSLFPLSFRPHPFTPTLVVGDLGSEGRRAVGRITREDRLPPVGNGSRDQRPMKSYDHYLGQKQRGDWVRGPSDPQSRPPPQSHLLPLYVPLTPLLSVLVDHPSVPPTRHSPTPRSKMSRTCKVVRT